MVEEKNRRKEEEEIKGKRRGNGGRRGVRQVKEGKMCVLGGGPRNGEKDTKV